MLSRGISVYSGLKEYPIIDTIKYLDMCLIEDIDFVFSSYHINEAIMNDDFELIINKVKEYKKDLIVDVNKNAYDILSKKYDNIIYRLDYGFSSLDILNITKKNQVVELNASCINKKMLDELKDLGVDFKFLRVSYNFYPKRYTGMSLIKVKELNKMFHEYNLFVTAFIPSNSMKRPPLFDGLTTIETERYQTIKDNVRELLLVGCDGVCIGDAYISKSDLLEFISIDKEVIEIPITINNNLSINELKILNSIHTLRIDENIYMHRSSSCRGLDVLPNNIKDIILPYSITIDNNNYLRYKGELGIIKQSIKNNGSINIVGFIDESYQYLVDLLNPHSKIKFTITNN